MSLGCVLDDISKQWTKVVLFLQFYWLEEPEKRVRTTI